MQCRWCDGVGGAFHLVLSGNSVCPRSGTWYTEACTMYPCGPGAAGIFRVIPHRSCPWARHNYLQEMPKSKSSQAFVRDPGQIIDGEKRGEVGLGSAFLWSHGARVQGRRPVKSPDSLVRSRGKSLEMERRTTPTHPRSARLAGNPASLRPLAGWGSTVARVGGPAAPVRTNVSGSISSLFLH